MIAALVLLQAATLTCPATTGLSIGVYGFAPEQIAAAAQVVDPQSGDAQVRVDFAPDGAEKFHRAINSRIGEPVPICLDGTLLASPLVAEEINGDSTVISGAFTVEEARAIAASLRGGKGDAKEDKDISDPRLPRAVPPPSPRPRIGVTFGNGSTPPRE